VILAWPFAQSAEAEPCLLLDEITAEHDARYLAGSVRGCVDEARYEDAIRVYFAYSNFILFDVQRIWDESAHVVMPELNEFVFISYSFDTINNLREVINKMRDPDSPFLAEVCADVAALGPPAYRPTYMIKRGMHPRRTDDDWLTEGFDPKAAWRKSLMEVNRCPEGTI
jgi:hypothetical protein